MGSYSNNNNQITINNNNQQSINYSIYIFTSNINVICRSIKVPYFIEKSGSTNPSLLIHHVTVTAPTRPRALVHVNASGGDKDPGTSHYHYEPPINCTLPWPVPTGAGQFNSLVPAPAGLECTYFCPNKLCPLCMYVHNNLCPNKLCPLLEKAIRPDWSPQSGRMPAGMHVHLQQSHGHAPLPYPPAAQKRVLRGNPKPYPAPRIVEEADQPPSYRQAPLWILGATPPITHCSHNPETSRGGKPDRSKISAGHLKSTIIPRTPKV